MLATPRSQIVGIHVNRHAGDAMTDDEGDDSDSDIHIIYILRYRPMYIHTQYLYTYECTHKTTENNYIILLLFELESAPRLLSES